MAQRTAEDGGMAQRRAEAGWWGWQRGKKWMVGMELQIPVEG